MSRGEVFWRDAAYYRNMLRLEETPGGVRPVRFTERQLAHFDRSELYAVRSRCPAGASLALHTDAEWMELDLTVEWTNRTYVQVQAAVEDKWCAASGHDPFGDTPCKLTFRIPLAPAAAGAGQQRQVEVFLPNYAVVSVADVRLSPGASASPAGTPALKLLALGDSITQGNAARNPAAAYPVRLARLLGAALLNQGVGGHDFDPDSFDNELPYEPDLITIAYGINDWAKNKTGDEIAANAAQLLGRVTSRYPGKPVLLATPLWHGKEGEARAAGTTADVRARIAEAAAGYADVHVIDGRGIVPGKPFLFADGLHPTDEGFAHYAVELYRHARRLIGE